MANVRAMGAPSPILGTKLIEANGTYNASSDGFDGFSQVTVSVPPGVLKSKSITQNGSYYASADNADGYYYVSVNVPTHNVTISANDPDPSSGANGDVHIKTKTTTNVLLGVSVTGGFNGGASLVCTIDDTTLLSATGTSPYNLDYDVKSASTEYLGHTIAVNVTPPPTSTDLLTVTWSIDNVTVWTASINYLGSNTSYGYDSNELRSVQLSGGTFIDQMFYKQNGTWLTVNDPITI